MHFVTAASHHTTINTTIAVAASALLPTCLLPFCLSPPMCSYSQWNKNTEPERALPAFLVIVAAASLSLSLWLSFFLSCFLLATGAASPGQRLRRGKRSSGHSLGGPASPPERRWGLGLQLVPCKPAWKRGRHKKARLERKPVKRVFA